MAATNDCLSVCCDGVPVLPGTNGSCKYNSENWLLKRLGQYHNTFSESKNKSTVFQSSRIAKDKVTGYNIHIPLFNVNSK
jgi:hypothetical protein